MHVGSACSSKVVHGLDGYVALLTHLACRVSCSIGCESPSLALVFGDPARWGALVRIIGTESL